jgi:chemotaxis protein MotB
MRRYRRYEGEEEASASWLLTFSDLLLLLLTTFVLKLSMASLQSGNLASGLGLTVEKSVQIQEASLKLGKQLRRALSEVMGPPTPLPGERAALRFADEVTLALVDRGVAISLGGGRFVPGKRELSPETADFIALLVRALQGASVFIRIEGHTDSSPIATTEFPSNWELSAARAISVAQALGSHGINGSDIAAVGYSDTRPVADNFSEIARAKNRRVELLIEPKL